MTRDRAATPHSSRLSSSSPPLTRRPLVRGAAVFEGVVFSSGTAISVAVRRPSGEVVRRVQMRRRATPFAWVRQVPFLRGMASAMGFAWRLGHANLFALQQADLFGPVGSAAVGGERLPTMRRAQHAQLRAARLLMGWLFWAVLGLILVFGGVPLIFAELAKAAPGRAHALCCHASGAIAATLLMTGYISLVGHSYSLSSWLAYHGAEHKVRAACAAHAPLTLPGVRPFAHAHSDCIMGRAAVLTLLGFLVSAFLAAACVPYNNVLLSADSSWTNLLAATLLRLVALVFATGLQKEVARVMSPLLRVMPLHRSWCHETLHKRSTWLSAASTEPPSDSQIDVALVALMGLVDAEQALEGGGYRVPTGMRKLSDACVRAQHRTQPRGMGGYGKGMRGAR